MTVIFRFTTYFQGIGWFIPTLGAAQRRPMPAK
jgi:hypothetical protein